MGERIIGFDRSNSGQMAQGLSLGEVLGILSRFPSDLILKAAQGL